MPTVEELDIIIRVLDRYSREIDELLLKLGELESVARSVDDITIDVDVRGEGKLDTLMARLAALQVMERADVDVSAGGGIGPLPPSFFEGDGLEVATARINAGVVHVNGAIQSGGGRGNIVPQVQGLANTLERAERRGGRFNLRMEDMHNALAKLIPMLLVFIGALPALITAVVALGAAMIAAVGAFGAIAGLGALGFAMERADGQMPAMEDFMDILRDLRDMFFEAFAPLAQRLLPTFERALRGVGVLFQRIADQGEILIALRSQFDAFGRFLLDWIPEALANMGRMVHAFRGVFAIIGEFFRETSFLEGLTNFFADALPALIQFGAITADIIPTIIEISIGFLRVSNAIVQFLSFIGALIGLLPITSEQFGIMVGSILSLITVLALANSQMLVTFITRMIALGQYVVPLVAQALGVANAQLVATSVAGKLAAAAIGTLTVAVLGLLAVSGVGLLIPILGGVGSSFLGMSDSVREATDALREFDSVGNRVSGVNPYGPSPAVADDAGLRRGTVKGRGGSTIVVNGNADDQALERAVARVNYANYRSTFRP